MATVDYVCLLYNFYHHYITFYVTKLLLFIYYGNMTKIVFCVLCQVWWSCPLFSTKFNKPYAHTWVMAALDYDCSVRVYQHFLCTYS